MNRLINKIFYLLVLMCVSHLCFADSRILATGGATQIEGQAGGGIVPWSVLTGYGSLDEVGAAAFATHIDVSDYRLNSYGASLSYDNRVEVSFAHQSFNLSPLAEALGLPDDNFRQNVFGLKVRLFGDLIFEDLPQVSIGVQYKNHLDFTVPGLVGAVHDSDYDFYISASKLWLAGLFDRNVFANATIRMTRANQTGLMGFGGDKEDSHEPMFEGSAGIFINRHLAIGGEYRQQPNNLTFSDEDDWFDIFVGYFPNKHISVVGAYANLGTVATLEDQEGWYLSLEIAY